MGTSSTLCLVAISCGDCGYLTDRVLNCSHYASTGYYKLRMDVLLRMNLGNLYNRRNLWKKMQVHYPAVMCDLAHPLTNTCTIWKTPCWQGILKNKNILFTGTRTRIEIVRYGLGISQIKGGFFWGRARPHTPRSESRFTFSFRKYFDVQEGSQGSCSKQNPFPMRKVPSSLLLLTERAEAYRSRLERV